VTIQLQAIFAGVLFGLWPLFMNRSGLEGNVSSTVFGIAVLVGVAPFALNTGFGSLANANWLMIVLAGVTGALGLLSFNGMLAKATAETVGVMFVLMIVTQTMIPAIYHIAMNGVSATKLVGILLALIGAALMVR
jgi:hypothetical protein